VDVEIRVAPGEDFLHHGETDELFTEKHSENPSGEEFLDEVIVEA